jgi:HD superfamily phosphohydrolase
MPKGFDLICKQTFPDDVEQMRFADERVCVNRKELEGVGFSIPDSISESMKHISQIGGKNIYFGRSPQDHNRWSHALGAYTVGLIWLKVLYEDNRIPRRFTEKPFPNFKTAETLVGYSLLLHDYGHLFFSHLLEEALISINWVPPYGSELSLEYRVLRDRLEAKDSATDELFKGIKTTLLQCDSSRAIVDNPLPYIFGLMNGWSGMPWLQSMVDGPIDADKIDYLRRDQRFLSEVGYSLQTRLFFGPTKGSECELPWMREFLYDQFVNHAGFLCLCGRSALAAADLWRERVYLYDRFYLAPAIRAADRIVLEIIQQFLIRCVMSQPFAEAIVSQTGIKNHFEEVGFKGLAELASTSDKAVDVITLKYLAVKDLLTHLCDLYGSTGYRDFEVLAFVKEQILDYKNIDSEYRELLREGWQQLLKLKERVSRPEKFAEECIVEQPLQFQKIHHEQIREIIRSFQHRYSGDVLIDVCVMPSVLSIPGPPGGKRNATSSNRFAQLLVPKGKVSSWGHGNERLEPLTTSKVEELEKPIGRVIILAPGTKKNSRARYVFDRFLATCKQQGIPLEESTI